MITGIILVIIFLSVLILVHELGHFLAAKKFGLLVEEFGMGLPPRIWGKKIGETIYSVNWLPFGGFVKIYGENGEEDNKKVTEPANEIIIAETEEKITISEDNIEAEEKISIAVENTPDSSNTMFDISEISIPMRDRNFSSLPVWKRMVIIFAGVFMNFILGWLVVSLVFGVGAPEAVLISDVSLNSPAAEAGLASGNRIIGFSKIDELQSFIKENLGKEIVLKAEQEGNISEFRLVPRVEATDGQGPLGLVLIQAGFPGTGFWESLSEGLKFSFNTVGTIFQFLFNLIGKIFIGKADFSQVAGPVGIVKITYQAGNMGIIYLLQLLALISLNLVVLNILPFPALDGGRLLFLLIEKIKGSPLPLKFERYANALGMVLLLILMIAITVKDIIKF